MKKVPFNNLRLEYLKYKEEYNSAIEEVLSRENYILVDNVLEFEIEFANYIGTRFCVGDC